MSLNSRANGSAARLPHIVVVGAGFGGLNAARTLAKYPVRVTLVDRENFHLFQPLLYQVATAALSPGDIAEPIRHIFRRQRNVRVMLAEVTGVDLNERRVTLSDGELHYDYLILSTGARHSYFGHPEWESIAPGLKTLEDALEIRRRILLAFEEAEQAEDPETRRALLTFVIVGGGPTGVELAGAIGEIARHTLSNEFRSIDPSNARVLLLEGAERILPTFPEGLAATAEQDLRRLGAEVRTRSMVSRVTEDAVYLGNEVIPSRTVFWAAGMAPSPLTRDLGDAVPLDRSGRVRVAPDLTLPGHSEVYVIGDAALLSQDNAPLPGVAPVAIQMGQAAAENAWRTIQGRARVAFRYRERGLMATIGRNSGIAQLGRFQLTGFIGWLAWLFVHIFFLIGFANRVQVLFKWAWMYVTYQRDARLITRRSPTYAAPERDQVEASSRH